MIDRTTIAAISTAYGYGGIGVIRISGAKVKKLMRHFFGKELKPRLAFYKRIKTSNDEILDSTVCIFFKGPSSYTGEDLLEIHTHGNPIIMESILEVIFSQGVRPATPGEFTERAFINNKLNLTQAEAVSDLIYSSSIASVKAANASIQGVFSDQISLLSDKLLTTRAKIEASIDFPEDDIPESTKKETSLILNEVISLCENLVESAKSGIKMNEKHTYCVVGQPNAGKSSLVNSLIGNNASIVSSIPGTTRDSLQYDIRINDYLVSIIDTAGLRQTSDEIEIEGIERTKMAIQRSQRVLYVVDDSIGFTEKDKTILKNFSISDYDLVFNKIDLSGSKAGIKNSNINSIYISIKENLGMKNLTDFLIKSNVGGKEGEVPASARVRHLNNANLALDSLYTAKKYNDNQELEFVAEELKNAYNHLVAILGTDVSEKLLDEIFSKFCIGK